MDKDINSQADMNKPDMYEKGICATGTLVEPTSAKQRVAIELADLRVKMHKLEEFLFGENIIEADLSQEMIRLLDAQLMIMKNYAAVLQNRLAIWDRKDKATFFHNFETRY